ncbi:MAG: hypothetical protein ABUL71_01250 [Gemmatimonadota bacterium]
MATLSPYRTLPADKRLALVTHQVSKDRPSRDGYIARIVSRGGGFRPEKLRKWPADQLAREVVRHNLETFQDELSLMVLLYVELEPQIQIAFLDALGVKHENGSIPEGLEGPFADAPKIAVAADGLIAQYGDDGRRYLRTIAIYNGEAWPGLPEIVRSW